MTATSTPAPHVANDICDRSHKTSILCQHFSALQVDSHGDPIYISYDRTLRPSPATDCCGRKHYMELGREGKACARACVAVVSCLAVL